MDKDLKKIIKALENQGFTIEVTTKQHIMVFRDGRAVATFSGSASDWRSMRNSISAARKAGFQWPPNK